MSTRTAGVGFLALLLLVTIGGEAFASTGRELYERKCGRCHTAFAPEILTSRQWTTSLRSMKERAGLSTEEVETITDYLHSEAPAEGDRASDEGPEIGGYLYTEYFQTDEETKNFDLHYLAIHMSGWLNDEVSYLAEFELEHGGKGENVFVEQAYIDYWLLPKVALKIGGMLTPFNRFDEFHEPLQNRLITRPLSNAVLPGITRRMIIKLAETGAITVEERLFAVDEAKDASEAFLTSASSFVMPVVEIDGVMVGGGQPGPVTRKLREMYIDEAKNG
jgi:hypothetical protein